MERILASPGLDFIASDVFLQLDWRTFAKLELVCNTWRNHVIYAKLWRRKLLRHFKEDFHRHLIQQTKINAVIEDDDLVELSNFFRGCAWRLNRGLILDWRFAKKFAIRRVANVNLLRDLKVSTESDRMAYAEENSIFVAKMSTFIDSVPCNGNASPLSTEHRLEGVHRRPVTCLALHGNLLVSTASRDRILAFWDLNEGKLITQIRDAHNRLITAIRVRNNLVVTSSRDRVVKLWRYSNDQVDELMTLEGIEQSHSVWAVDFNKQFLVSGSADNLVRCWTVDSDYSQSFLLAKKRLCKPFRSVHLIRCCRPFALLAVDIMANIALYDLENRKLIQEIDNEDEISLVSVDECEFEAGSLGMIAVASASLKVTLYLSHKRLLESGLKPYRFLNLREQFGLQDNFLLRSVCLTRSQIFVASYASNRFSLLALDAWNAEYEEKDQEEPTLKKYRRNQIQFCTVKDIKTLDDLHQVIMLK